MKCLKLLIFNEHEFSEFNRYLMNKQFLMKMILDLMNISSCTANEEAL